MASQNLPGVAAIRAAGYPMPISRIISLTGIATLLLAPPGFSTLATEVWQAAELANYEDAAVYALVLVAISAALTWFLVVRPALRSWNRPPESDATDAVRLPPEPVAG
jgi:benzoate membrane transport protein